MALSFPSLNLLLRGQATAQGHEATRQCSGDSNLYLLDHEIWAFSNSLGEG